jgi:hypothetical protein
VGGSTGRYARRVGEREREWGAPKETKAIAGRATNGRRKEDSVREKNRQLCRPFPALAPTRSSNFGLKAGVSSSVLAVALAPTSSLFLFPLLLRRAQTSPHGPFAASCPRSWRPPSMPPFLDPSFPRPSASCLEAAHLFHTYFRWRWRALRGERRHEGPGGNHRNELASTPAEPAHHISARTDKKLLYSLPDVSAIRTTLTFAPFLATVPRRGAFAACRAGRGRTVRPGSRG